MIDTKQVTDKIEIPQQFQDAYERVCMAGMKVLFEDDQMHQQIVQRLEADDGKPIDQKLSNGIVNMMGMLFKKSGGKMPGQVIIPAAVYLLMQMIEFVQKSGHELPNDIIANATQQVVFGIMEATGVGKKDQVMGKFQQIQQKQGGA